MAKIYETDKLKAITDSTSAIQFNKADGTTVVMNLDTTNSRLGLGVATPTNKLHIDNGTATDNYLQFTAGTTTGQGVNDGFQIGVDSTGRAILSQREAQTFSILMAGTPSLVIGTTGNVAIGNLNPTARLHLSAGSAAANTAPFKMTNGPLLTAPEDGAIERFNNHLYYTIGTTRQMLDQVVNTALTYYVSTTGSDSNDGLTTGTAFRTIQFAINSVPKHLQESATINIMDGTYTESVITISGFVGKSLIIKSNSNSTTAVTINGTFNFDNSGNKLYLQYFTLNSTGNTGVYSAGYIVIKNVKIVAKTGGSCFENDADRAVIVDCTIDAGTGGVYGIINNSIAAIYTTTQTGSAFTTGSIFANQGVLSTDEPTMTAMNPTPTREIGSFTVKMNNGQFREYGNRIIEGTLLNIVNSSSNINAMKIRNDALWGNNQITNLIWEDNTGASVSAIGAKYFGVDVGLVFNSMYVNAYKTFTDVSMTVRAAGVAIGSNTAPTARLHLPAGTATANTTPLKFDSGTLVTVLENGTVEYDGNFYVTTSKGRTQISNAVTGSEANCSRAFPANTAWDATNETQWKSGFWQGYQETWLPDSGYWWGMTTAHLANTSSYNYSGQLIFNLAGTKCFFRTINNSVAGTWNEISHTGNTNRSTEYSIYVATTGSDTTGDGTSGNPYKTLTYAISKMPFIAKNVTIYLANGTYTEGEISLMGLGCNTLTIISQTNNKTNCIINGSFKINNHGCRTLLRYLTINGDSAITLSVASYLRLADCTISAISTAFCLVTDAERSVISDTLFVSNSSAYGVIFNADTYLTNCTKSGTFSGADIRVNAGQAVCDAATYAAFTTREIANGLLEVVSGELYGAGNKFILNNSNMNNIYPAADSTTAFRIFKADKTTQCIAVDTTNNKFTVTGNGVFVGQAQFNNSINMKNATNNYIYYDTAFSITKNGIGDKIILNSSDNVGLSVSNPTARLHLPAGTATAGTAPLKLTSGTALTTPEDGAIEYHNSHLYFTINNTRYQLDQQSAGSSTPKMLITTDYSTSARLATTSGNSGSANFSSGGMYLTTSSTAGGYINAGWYLCSGNNLILGNPTYTTYISCSALGTDVELYVGLGVPLASATGISFATSQHAGFKITRTASGTCNLYATNGNGTSVTTSAAITTVEAVSADHLDLIISVTSGTEIKYYYRKNGGSLTLGATHTTNLPTNVNNYTANCVTNKNVATNSTFYFGGASYTR